MQSLVERMCPDEVGRLSLEWQAEASVGGIHVEQPEVFTVELFLAGHEARNALSRCDYEANVCG